MNLLAIGAHPDDIEFGCAPVLMKEIRKGNQVKLLVLSLGEAGTSGTPELRERESRDAAARMGAAVEGRYGSRSSAQEERRWGKQSSRNSPTR